MQQDQPPESEDGLHAELSDLRVQLPPDVRRAAIGRRPPWDRRPARGRSASRLVGLVAIGLLMILLVLRGWPGAWAAAVGLFVHPTPTPVVLPVGDAYYMLPNPPGVSVWIDGSPLRSLPLPGTRPLHLAPGRHTLEWLPGFFPFRSLKCVLSVPHVGDDTCVLEPGYVLPADLIPAGISSIDLSVIVTRESLTTLPPEQASALTSAIQQALDALSTTATVAVGERYYAYAPNGSGQVRVATQPLRATLRLILRGPGAPGACTLSPGAVQPCRAPGQDCSEICTLANLALTGSGYVWSAAVVVSADWSYATPSEQPVAQHVGEPGLNANLAVMLLGWDGSGWIVSPFLRSHTTTPETDDALCDPARNWLASGPLVDLLRAAGAGSGTGQQVRLQYASGQELTDGCVVSITGYGPGAAPQSVPPALFLGRFGVLLSANDAAHALWPDLPMADAAQAADAEAMATAANISH